MEHRAEKLEDQISETRDEWERKQRDPSVPGATGEPASAEAEEPDEPEAEAEDEEPETQAGDEGGRGPRSRGR